MSSRNAPPLWGGVLRDDTKNGCVADYDDGDSDENGKKKNRFRVKQQLCSCITLFCSFLCRHCTTTTWKCLRNSMASVVENTSRKPLETRFPRLYISKCPEMPWPSRTCAFGMSSKAAYYSLTACYLKTFWQGPGPVKIARWNFLSPQLLSRKPVL